MTRGATQYLYVSHAGDTDGMEDAAIYKVRLDGTVVGKFGIGREAAEGVRSRQLDRLPQRERAADRRDDQLARAEGVAEGQIAKEGNRQKDKTRTLANCRCRRCSAGLSVCRLPSAVCRLPFYFPAA